MTEREMYIQETGEDPYVDEPFELTCDVCGERFDGDDIGEFYDPETDRFETAHHECGLSNGLELA